MNKAAIKNFAIWARRKLIADIAYTAGLIGVTEQGIAAPLPQSTQDLQFFDIGTKKYAEVAGTRIAQRKAFVSAINDRERTCDYKTAYQNVIEEVAYTWFNRLIAIRFMEVNDYLPSRVRVLSSEAPKKNEPDFVTTPFETDLTFTSAETNLVIQLQEESRLDELFRILFIKQCNKLHEILPELFEPTGDYTEMLLTVSFTDVDDVVYHLTHDVAEDDFNLSHEGQVEIIGWLYQYYNTEPKDEVFALLKKNVKITKERIPAATQLFTPDWIVRYMVENSLGRLWVEGHPNEGLKGDWKYYLEEAEQEPSVRARLEEIRAEYKTLSPENIKIIDPCMGSGHILVYAFEVLMQIYETQGYTQRDAARRIVERNLYGLDIDKRAYQLAYFAVMMKARQYNRRILSDGIAPNLYAIQDSGAITDEVVEYIAGGDANLRAAMESIRADLTDATEYGSIIDVAPVDFDALYARLEALKAVPLDRGIDISAQAALVKQARCMVQKYNVVCTNPPYMGSSGMSGKLSEYVKTQYPDSKSDLFAVFIERCGQMLKQNGYQAMITQHAWMFLSSFEKLREKLLRKDTVNMAHLGARAFEEIGGEVVQTTSFVLRNSHIKACKGVYCRLIEPNTQQGKEDMFLAGENRFAAQQENFVKIPGAPVAYWVSENVRQIYALGKPINNYSTVFEGLKTRDKDTFLRLWFEVYNKKWVHYAKGGSFRRWYGNGEYVVDWGENGDKVRSFIKSSGSNFPYFFRPSVTYTALTSYKFSGRYIDSQIFGGGGGITKSKYIEYILGFVNSNVFHYIINVISSTLNFEVGQIGSQPLTLSDSYDKVVKDLVCTNISISRADWDSFETSWDFERHPLVRGASSVAEAYSIWERECEQRFQQLKANEEELNRIFIDIYGLQNELSPDVADKDVTVRRADVKRDVRSLLSYAVGCMLGRYSLDMPGLAYAGGKWDPGKYATFIPDADNCIPITDEEYFHDDIVSRLIEFLRAVYGRESLEDNLDFIARALGSKGNNSREIIRNYFLNEFIKDHIKVYQKRPIYWLFDSGKQHGFKALVYMHRWNADTTGNVRVEYLHRLQRTYEKEIERMQDTVENSRDAHEISVADKRQGKLARQLKEVKDYDTRIAHLALSRIVIDLDDGVKVNYEKVQTARDGSVIEILARI